VADKNVKTQRDPITAKTNVDSMAEDIMAAAKASTPDTSAPPAAEATPAVTVTVNPLQAEFDKLMAGLPDKNTDGSVNLIKKLFKVSPLDVNLLETVRESYKAAHPKGMLDAFKTAVQTAIIDAAAEYMVTLDGMEVLARFPQGEGTVLTVEVEACGRFVEKAEGKAGKSKKAEGETDKTVWGPCSVTDAEGKVKTHKNPSVMARALGLRINGHPDQVHTFTHPKKAVGLDWEDNFVDGLKIEVVTGDTANGAAGIHVKIS
jgi:hypothetical protein